jgi:hypothetical protein
VGFKSGTLPQIEGCHYVNTEKCISNMLIYCRIIKISLYLEEHLKAFRMVLFDVVFLLFRKKQLWARSIVRIVLGPPEPRTWVQIPASPFSLQIIMANLCDICLLEGSRASSSMSVPIV